MEAAILEFSDTPPTSPTGRRKLAPLEQRVQDAAGDPLAQPGADGVQGVPFLHGMDDIRLCEHGAARGDARGLAAERRRAAGELLDGQPETLGLLLQEGPGARRARRVGGMLAVGALLIQQDQ